MSDSSQVALRSVEESTWGTTPASALDTVAYATSVTGGIEVGNVVTAALRSDYNKPKQIRTTADGNLAVNFELAYGDVPMASWFEGLFRSDWSAALSVTGTTISFDASGSTIDDSGSGFATTWANKWVKVSGSTSNDGHYFVTAASSGSLTVSSTLGDAPLTTEAAGDSVTVKNDGALLQGTTLKSYSIERDFADLSSTQYLAQKGCRVSGGSLNVDYTQLVTGTINFVGKPPSAPSGSSVGTGAANAASTDEVFNATGNVSAVLEGGAAVTANVSSIALNFGSAMRPQHAIASTDPFGIGGNSREWTGTLSLYNDDNGLAIWEKLRADTASSLYFRLTDADGNVLQFSFPAIKYRGGNPDVSGIDQDVILPVEFYCELDDTTSIMGQIDRFSA